MNLPPKNPDTERHSDRIKYSTGIAALESVAGRDAALAIIAACAGREILVRPIPLPDDELVRLVGLEAAQAIADELLGDEDGATLFFIDQPGYVVHSPGEKIQPEHDASAPPRDQALRGVLGDIEEVCGREAALKIAAHYGGRRLYVPYPERLNADSSVAKVIGLEAAEALAEAFRGGSLIEIPPAAYGSSAVRRELGMKMLREGYRPADVTRILKVARSVVFEWSRKIKEEQK